MFSYMYLHVFTVSPISTTVLNTTTLTLNIKVIIIIIIIINIIIIIIIIIITYHYDASSGVFLTNFEMQRSGIQTSSWQ